MKHGLVVILFIFLVHLASSQPADSTGLAIAGKEYKAGLLKKIFLGPLYRSSWTATVRVPYLNLDTTFGGLKPLRIGGGRQTTSLFFMASNGYTYTFRSVD